MVTPGYLIALSLVVPSFPSFLCGFYDCVCLERYLRCSLCSIFVFFFVFFSRVVCVVVFVNDVAIILLKMLKKSSDKSVNFLVVVLMVEFGVFFVEKYRKEEMCLNCRRRRRLLVVWHFYEVVKVVAKCRKKCA